MALFFSSVASSEGGVKVRRVRWAESPRWIARSMAPRCGRAVSGSCALCVKLASLLGPIR